MGKDISFKKKEVTGLFSLAQKLLTPIPLPLRYQNWWEFSQVYKRISQMPRTQHEGSDISQEYTLGFTGTIDFFDIDGRLAPLRTTKNERWDDLALFHAYLGEHDYDIGSKFWSNIGKIPRESPAIFISGRTLQTNEQYTRKDLTSLVRESFHTIEDALNQGYDKLVIHDEPTLLYSLCYATKPIKKRLFLIPGYKF